MAKKQTRRSVSISKVTYQKLKAFCEANHISMSQFTETALAARISEHPVEARP